MLRAVAVFMLTLALAGTAAAEPHNWRGPGWYVVDEYTGEWCDGGSLDCPVEYNSYLVSGPYPDSANCEAARGPSKFPLFESTCDYFEGRPDDDDYGWM